MTSHRFLLHLLHNKFIFLCIRIQGNNSPSSVTTILCRSDNDNSAHVSTADTFLFPLQSVGTIQITLLYPTVYYPADNKSKVLLQAIDTWLAFGSFSTNEVLLYTFSIFNSAISHLNSVCGTPHTMASCPIEKLSRILIRTYSSESFLILRVRI